MYLQASIFWKRCRFYPRAVEMGYETKRRRWASFKFQSICTVSKTESSKAEKLKLLNWFIQKHYKLNTLCTISKFLARWSGWDHPQLCKTSRPLSLSRSLSTELQSWLLRLDCDRRPPREKIEATEWAKPTTIPTFTWPLLGIGRPENLCEKFPPLIMALLPPAMAFLRRSKGWWGECKEYDSGMVVGCTVKGRWLYI